MIDRARIDLGGYIVGRIENSGRIFEMLMDPEKAWEAKKLIREEINVRLKAGKEKSRITVEELLNDRKVDLELIFESFTVFEDLKRGKKATDGDMEAVFNTTDGMTIAGHILLDGEIHWTKAQREEEIHKKLKQIITIISKNAINPQNNRIEQVEMAIKIPATFTAKGYNIVAQYVQIKKEEWQSDGSWVSVVSLPAGLQMELIDKLNKLTHGRVQTKILKA